MSDLSKQLEANLKRLRSAQQGLQPKAIPIKKRTKKSTKMQNTFRNSVQGMPGGGSIVKMIAAKGTGCRVTGEVIGTMRSARVANTTQGSYNRTVLRDQTGDVISNAQGRRI